MFEKENLISLRKKKTRKIILRKKAKVIFQNHMKETLS